MYRPIDYSRFNAQLAQVEPIFEQGLISGAAPDSTSVKKPIIPAPVKSASSNVKLTQSPVLKQAQATPFKSSVDAAKDKAKKASIDAISKGRAAAAAPAKTVTPAKADPKNLEEVKKGIAVLKFGSKGDAVKELQAKLGITIDGVFGQRTKEAVDKFQKDNALKVDSIVGQNTVAALDKPKSATSAAPSTDTANPEAVATTTAPASDAPATPKTAAQLDAEYKAAREAARGLRKERRQVRRSEKDELERQQNIAKLKEKKQRLESKSKEIQDGLASLGESRVYNFSEFLKLHK